MSDPLPLDLKDWLQMLYVWIVEGGPKPPCNPYQARMGRTVYQGPPPPSSRRAAMELARREATRRLRLLSDFEKYQAARFGRLTNAKRQRILLKNRQQAIRVGHAGLGGRIGP